MVRCNFSRITRDLLFNVADTWIQPGYWEKIDAYLTSIGLGVPSSSANASTTL